MSAPVDVAPVDVVVLGSESTPPLPNADRLGRLARLHVTDASGLAATLEETRAPVLLLWDFLSSALQDAWDTGSVASSLRWVHVAAAGVNTLLFPGLRDSAVTVTNAKGVFDTPIAEYVLGAILAQDKQMHLSARLQAQHVWRHRETRLTHGSHALVVGTGGIGRTIARLLRAAGLDVRGAGRTARDADPDFGTIVATSALAAEIGWADHVVLVAPLTEDTRGLLSAEVLANARPGVHVINVGRGALIDEAALLDALASGVVGAATLDVFDEEPLRPDHPFWELDTVVVTPHMSGDAVGWRDRLAAQFEANLERYVAGERLLNPVDKQLGYSRS